MNADPTVDQSAARAPARPQSLSEARAGIDFVIESQSPTKASGYVKIDGDYFHIAKTQSGPIVSLLEWKKGKEDQPGFLPVHNLFSVDLDTRDKAVSAWEKRNSSVDSKNKANVDRNQIAAQPSPMKPTRSGVR